MVPGTARPLLKSVTAITRVILDTREGQLTQDCGKAALATHGVAMCWQAVCHQHFTRGPTSNRAQVVLRKPAVEPYAVAGKSLPRPDTAKRCIQARIRGEACCPSTATLAPLTSHSLCRLYTMYTCGKSARCCIRNSIL